MSAYSSAVLVDGPFAYYPDASAAPWVDDAGANDMTITGATPDVAGPLTNGDTRAFSFDGVDDRGSVALDLSDTSIVTLEFWLWWDAFANDFDVAVEHTAQWDLNNGSLLIDPNWSDASNPVLVGHRGDTGTNAKLYTRPSAAAWHHWASVHDLTAAAAGEVAAFYIDGVAQTALSQLFSTANGGAFANSTITVMGRGGSSLEGAGDMAHFAVYKSALPADRVSAHFAAQSGPLEQTAIWPFNRQGPF